MSFAERGELKDAYNTFCLVYKDKGFRAYKVDHHIDAKQRIVPTIFDSIRRCAFVIADVTDAKPNVYYELGYARALGKTVIQTAREGINLPFVTTSQRCSGTVKTRSNRSSARQSTTSLQRVCVEGSGGSSHRL